MKFYFFFFTLFSFLLFSCNENTSSKEKPLESSVNTDSQLRISKLDTINVSDTSKPALAESKKDTNLSIANAKGIQLKAGIHNISIQWISFDHPGKAMVTDLKEGSYKIEGKQNGDQDDYLSINGIIHPLSEKELEFNGIISSKIGIINKGAVCIRKGKYTFIAPSNKKYWRLKEKINCEGGMVTDLIDIQF